jgi:hypothetical protein
VPLLAGRARSVSALRHDLLEHPERCAPRQPASVTQPSIAWLC